MFLCFRYIHEKELAHMDIKPDNIFLHENGKVESLLDNNDSTASSSKSNEETKELIYKLGKLLMLLRIVVQFQETFIDVTF